MGILVFLFTNNPASYFYVRFIFGLGYQNLVTFCQISVSVVSPLWAYENQYNVVISVEQVSHMNLVSLSDT